MEGDSIFEQLRREARKPWWDAHKDPHKKAEQIQKSGTAGTSGDFYPYGRREEGEQIRKTDPFNKYEQSLIKIGGGIDPSGLVPPEDARNKKWCDSFM